MTCSAAACVIVMNNGQTANREARSLFVDVSKQKQHSNSETVFIYLRKKGGGQVLLAIRWHLSSSLSWFGSRAGIQLRGEVLTGGPTECSLSRGWGGEGGGSVTWGVDLVLSDPPRSSDQWLPAGRQGGRKGGISGSMKQRRALIVGHCVGQVHLWRGGGMSNFMLNTGSG